MLEIFLHMLPNLQPTSTTFIAIIGETFAAWSILTNTTAISLSILRQKMIDFHVYYAVLKLINFCCTYGCPLRAAKSGKFMSWLFVIEQLCC